MLQPIRTGSNTRIRYLFSRTINELFWKNIKNDHIDFDFLKLLH